MICSCGFVLWCVVDDGCAVFCGAVGFFFFFAVDGWWLWMWLMVEWLWLVLWIFFG